MGEKELIGIRHSARHGKDIKNKTKGEGGRSRRFEWLDRGTDRRTREQEARGSQRNYKN